MMNQESFRFVELLWQLKIVKENWFIVIVWSSVCCMVLHFGWDPLSMCIAGAEILQISILAKASYDPRDRDNSWRCTLHNTNCMLYTLRFIWLKTQHQFLTQCTLSVSYKSSLLLTSLLMALKMNHLELILLNCSGRWTFLFCICCVHYLSFCICVQICLTGTDL